MPRFVVLYHEMPADSDRASHYDLLIEPRDGAERLFTWAMLELPAPATPIASTRLPDHRRTYLEYEGPISGGRGTVARWDEGTCDWLPNTGAAQRVANETLIVSLRGQRIVGRLTLTCQGDSPDAWVAQFE